MERKDKSGTKIILEMAEEMFKDARGTTELESKAINDFIRTKSKVILRESMKKM